MSSNNSTREIPISETLENLLTDVEFEYSDVTLEESTTTSTVPAESNLTADSETTEEPRGLPDHEFIRKTINGKKGKMKGVARTVFTLIIGPHTYKNNRNYKGLYYFYCVDCLKKKKCVSAVAEQVAGEDPEQYTYVLLEAPSIDQHCCEQDGTKAAINKARFEMRRLVQDDSNHEIPQIYEQVRKETFAEFDEYGQLALTAEFPSYRNIQSYLFKERRCHVPPEPKCVADLDLDRELFLEGKENIIKGDTLISDNKRVIMYSTDALLDVLARGKQILGDGTFKITPRGWTQVFTIAAQVDMDGTFVTCAYILLPDKKRESYNIMFSMLKEALSRRGLELSAEFFMSDFEIAIRQAFMQIFPTVMVRGCLFHYAKAIVGKVHKKGFKSDFADMKNNGPFCAFVRSVLGLPYVPLRRLNEGIRNLYIMAKKLHGKQRHFAISMIKYVESVWINGNFAPITWNVSGHDGVSTNNSSEANNRKLGAKMKAHPNFYAFCGAIKKEISFEKEGS